MLKDNFTYDDWKNDPGKPTIVFDHPNAKYGKISFYVDNDARKKAAGNGEIVFGPREILRSFIADDMGYFKNSANQPSKLAEAILSTKKSFPSAVIIDYVGPLGRVDYRIKKSETGCSDADQMRLERELADTERSWKADAQAEKGAPAKEEVTTADLLKRISAIALEDGGSAD